MAKYRAVLGEEYREKVKAPHKAALGPGGLLDKLVLHQLRHGSFEQEDRSMRVLKLIKHHVTAGNLLQCVCSPARPDKHFMITNFQLVMLSKMSERKRDKK